jgi:hypothetical protein
MADMDEKVRENRLGRLATIIAVVAVLAAIAFVLRRPMTGDNARPLYPHDRMRMWQSAGPGTKHLTADIVLDQLQRDGHLGPRAMANLRDAGRKQALVDELIAALDAASDKNRTEYVSPDDSILLTAQIVATKRGWDK